MRALLAATSFLAITACSGEAAPPAEGGDAAAPAAAAARDGCADIAAMAAAMTETTPFASLRTGNVMLGDHAVKDSYTTDITPAGATCKLGEMSGWNPGDPPMFVANCQAFSSNSLNEEENGVKAKAAFDAVKQQLDTCLPAGWASREGSNNGDERTESLIYETAADKARSETADFYVYPLELQKEYYTGTMRGGKMPGWYVTINFQTQGAKPETTPAEH